MLIASRMFQESTGAGQRKENGLNGKAHSTRQMPGSGEGSDIYKLVKMLMERNFDPVR